MGAAWASGFAVGVQVAIWAAFLVGATLAKLPPWLAVAICIFIASVFVTHRWLRRHYVDALPEPGGE